MEWKDFFKNKALLALIILLFVAFFVRVSYMNINTAEWWDSADYMTGAKEFAGVANLDTYDINPKRPFFLMILWGAILWLGFGDAGMHFSVVIFALLGIYFTFLLGKSMFNNWAGVIGAGLLAFNWLHIFHSARLLTDIIAMTFWLMSAYYFWKYVDSNKPKYLMLAGIFFGFAWFTRGDSIMMAAPLFITILFKEKISVFKNKNAWISLLLVLVVMSPFFIWLYSSFENPFQRFAGVGGDQNRFASGGDFSYLWKNLQYISSVTLSPSIAGSYSTLLSLIMIGLLFYLIGDFLLGIDFMWKKGDKNLIRNLFLLSSILTPYIFYSLAGRGVEPRYLFKMFPFMFIVFGNGLVRLGRFLNKNKKNMGVVIILLILLPIFYFNHVYGVSLTANKASSYAEVALAGQWIKENSSPDDKVISASVFQNMYYSERNTYSFFASGDDRDDTNKFLERVHEINPKFIVISVFEPAFTPQWIYNLPNERNDLFKPARAYTNQQNQPILVIYEYTGGEDS